MVAPRPFALVRTRDQWLRAAHDRTYLDVRTDSVELDWSVTSTGTGAPAPTEGAGLCFDAECRLYRSVPLEGRVEKLLWAARHSASQHASSSQAMDLFRAPEGPVLGDFTPSAAARTALQTPRGLAVDCDDRLFIAEASARSVLIFDLRSERQLQRLFLPGTDGPFDLAAAGKSVYAVMRSPAALFRLSVRRDPRSVPLDPSILAPSRLSISSAGVRVLLDRAGTADAKIVPLASIPDAFTVGHATDLEFQSDDVLVVAREPGADFLRFRLAASAGSSRLSIEELPPLKARGYDGLGIVRCPDGSIGFYSPKGFRTAVAARINYERRGRVCSYRLDSGEFQTQWGRLFLDACVPAGTSLRVASVTLDDPPEDADTLPRTPPTKLISEIVARPDLSPPMPPRELVPAADMPLPGSLHPRESGRELPWSEPPSTDSFITYEAPILAPPGRYLWVFLELSGNTKLTPRVRALRAEYPSHSLLRRLPRAFSRDVAAADFLRRMLAMFDGFFSELEGRAAARESLVLPRATPEDLLPWLSKFVGLVLDERWSSEVRRTFIEEAVLLFRFRGTLGALTRMLEIALQTKPILLEHFRLRGMGGAIVGAEGAAVSTAVLGGGMRVGGSIGEPGVETPLTGTLDDAFRVHAHRFSVIVPRALTPDELDGAKFILDEHRPAHTLYDICTVDAGMRAGLGLHLGISSLVGRSGAFATLQLGGSALGRGTIVGRPNDALSLGNARLGVHTRMG